MASRDIQGIGRPQIRRAPRVCIRHRSRRQYQLSLGKTPAPHACLDLGANPYPDHLPKIESNPFVIPRRNKVPDLAHLCPIRPRHSWPAVINQGEKRRLRVRPQILEAWYCPPALVVGSNNVHLQKDVVADRMWNNDIVNVARRLDGRLAVERLRCGETSRLRRWKPRPIAQDVCLAVLMSIIPVSPAHARIAKIWQLRTRGPAFKFRDQTKAGIRQPAFPWRDRWDGRRSRCRRSPRRRGSRDRCRRFDRLTGRDS